MFTFFDLVVVETDGGYGVFVVDAISDGFDESGLACVLKTDDCYLKFFVEEPALDPVDYFIENPSITFIYKVNTLHNQNLRESVPNCSLSSTLNLKKYH